MADRALHKLCLNQFSGLGQQRKTKENTESKTTSFEMSPIDKGSATEIEATQTIQIIKM